MIPIKRPTFIPFTLKSPTSTTICVHLSSWYSRLNIAWTFVLLLKKGTQICILIVIWIHMLKYREIKVFSMILIIHVFTNNNIFPVSCICYTYPHRNFQNPSKKYPLISLHPDISMHILYTVLYTFLSILTRRICLKIKSFFSWWSFPLFSWPQCAIQGW